MDLEKINQAHDEHAQYNTDIPWRAWGSWFSWGSPVGMGIFIMSIGVFILLLHYAGLVH